MFNQRYFIKYIDGFSDIRQDMNMKKSFDAVKNINKLSGLFLPRGVFY